MDAKQEIDEMYALNEFSKMISTLSQLVADHKVLADAIDAQIVRAKREPEGQAKKYLNDWLTNVTMAALSANDAIVLLAKKAHERWYLMNLTPQPVMFRGERPIEPSLVPEWAKKHPKEYAAAATATEILRRNRIEGEE